MAILISNGLDRMVIVLQITVKIFIILHSKVVDQKSSGRYFNSTAFLLDKIDDSFHFYIA